MAAVTITEILDDLRAADEITRRFEWRYWLSSADFYELYSQGLLVDCRRDVARNSRLAVPSSSERLEAKKPSG